jgi:hypothetical protein
MLMTLLAACSSDGRGSENKIATRDDLVIVAKPGGAVRVDVLANDTTADGAALELVSTSASENAAVSIDQGWLVIKPAPDFRGTIEVRYRVRSASGDESTTRETSARLTAHQDGQLTIYVDSYFDEVLTRLEKGELVRRHNYLAS